MFHSRELYCGDAIDSLCENSLDTPYHHRNANKNLEMEIQSKHGFKITVLSYALR